MRSPMPLIMYTYYRIQGDIAGCCNSSTSAAAGVGIKVHTGQLALPSRTQHRSLNAACRAMTSLNQLNKEIPTD